MNKSEKFKRIRESISIVDYARSIGLTPIKKGKYYSLKEHDSVMINVDKNIYWQNSVPGSYSCIGKQGSVIDFAMCFNHMTCHEAVKEFEQMISGCYETPKRRVQNNMRQSSEELILPERDVNMRKVFAYLMKTRCIAQSVVQDMVNRKMLYQDKNGNCVFVGYDIEDKNKIVFATKRGTNTEKPFYGDAKGCNYDKCLYIDNGSDILCVTESVIDAMSIMTMTVHDDTKFDYLILAGIGKWKCIDTYLKTGKFKKVIIAVDNDKAGIEIAETIWNFMELQYSSIDKSKVLPPLKQGKDWNKVLQTMSNKEEKDND